MKTRQHLSSQIRKARALGLTERKQLFERWVALPKGAGAVGPGDSLFGSFVGLFITHVPAADRTLAFRTPSFAKAELARAEATK